MSVEERQFAREPEMHRHEGGLAAQAATAAVGPPNGMDNNDLSKPNGGNSSLGLKNLMFSFLRLFQLRSSAATNMVTEDQSPTRVSNSNGPCRMTLSARERDMMDFSPRGDVTGVHYEDGKGLGGCRLQ